VTVYLDTSALLKLLIREAGTSALRSELAGRLGPRVASALVRTELRRAVRRIDVRATGSIDRLLDGLALVPLDDAVLDAAGRLEPPGLRSLDAVHLASALRVAPVDALVTYDRRMAAAAAEQGLAVLSPA
jgi:uncharacterized protein